MQPEHFRLLSPYRLVREGFGSYTEIEQMSLDDVDLAHLYLDAVEEAELIERMSRDDGGEGE